MADFTLDQGVCINLLCCSGNRELTSVRARRQTIPPRLLALVSIAVLISMRISRRWNQTGQKFAGEDDIARTFFSSHKLLFWGLVVLTYLWNLQSLATRGFSRFPQTVSGAIATGLATASVTFKLAFTSQDSPELMAGPAKSMAENDLGVSLVLRARIVFVAILICLLYTLATGLGLQRRPNRMSDLFTNI
jgi:ethanolaminephosphotransferase